MNRIARMFCPGALWMAVIFTALAPPLAFGASKAINCQAHDGVCTLAKNGVRVSLDITPKPVKAMHDLNFRVTVEGEGNYTPTHIDLGMPAMKMGPNQVVLKPDGAGGYAGKGIIVRCPSGKRTWMAQVHIEGLGMVEFVFDVVY